jgi:transcriptional regulator with XRE-family HTH domain
MEWNVRLNWPTLVEEARQRRGSLKLTQRQLAQIAGVSAPTVSRFERAEKDLQLSSALSILEVLGLIDERELVFPEQEPRYDFDRDIIVFAGRDRDNRVPCAVSREAMEDFFQVEGKNLVASFVANRAKIEHWARRKYLSGRRERDGSVLVRTEDLA